jgi:hypothetical protein
MIFRDNDEKTRRELELDPWPVIVACLFELDSYEIPGAIDTSGMTVDWTLTAREDYSHKYRRAAYRPRINRAYESLNSDNRLRVAFILSEELARRGLADKLDADLQRIGWRIDGGFLVPASETVRELFFPQGTQHDAYVRIREIIRRARLSLRIIDPYLDGTVFTILGDAQISLKVELLTGKLPPDFALETAKFQKQHAQVRIETRRSRDFHDRFIIIDETECWHIGCSIKDAGNKAFMLSLMEDPKNSQSLLHALQSTWANAKPNA